MFKQRMFKLVFKSHLSSDPWGNEMIFHGRNWDIAALWLPAESNGSCSDEGLSLLSVRHADTLWENWGWSSSGCLDLLCAYPLWSSIHDKPGGMAFSSVSTANQVSSCLNYLCQELNVGLHKQCVLLTKTWIWGWESILASQVGFLWVWCLMNWVWVGAKGTGK